MLFYLTLGMVVALVRVLVLDIVEAFPQKDYVCIPDDSLKSAAGTQIHQVLRNTKVLSTEVRLKKNFDCFLDIDWERAHLGREATTWTF